MSVTDVPANVAVVPRKPRSKRDRKRDRERMRANKVRLKSLDHIDRRTMAAHRARQVVQRIETDLGGSEHLSESSKQLVQRAAILSAVIEAEESSWLGGGKVDYARYFTAVNIQRRVLATLGLERRARDVSESIYDIAREENEKAVAAEEEKDIE